MGADPVVTAVVPALDEEDGIATVVAGLLRQGLVDEVVVVDNGSADATTPRARAAGARVVREPRRGYGRACHAGVLAADGSDVIVLLDGDAADDPGDLAAVLAPLLAGEADLVVGSRGRAARQRGAMTPQQIAGNRVACGLMRALHGMRVTDLGPFRAIRRDQLLALDMAEMTYGWSAEMVVKAGRAGLRYREVPVGYRRRIGVSKVGGTLRGSVGAATAITGAILRHSRWRPAGATA
ncbi:MAG TPA: glycosyltransferase family 2 protein [Miltoncostaeaceae bacterium]|nr:glycosyltransferase family 2 protein [Miltoncostaeaceae bacterium]